MKKKCTIRNRPIRSSAAVREKSVHRYKGRSIRPKERMEYHPLFPGNFVFEDDSLHYGSVKKTMQAVYIDRNLRAYGGLFCIFNEAVYCIEVYSYPSDDFPFLHHVDGTSVVIAAQHRTDVLIEKMGRIDPALMDKAMFFDSMPYDNRKYTNALSQAVMRLRNLVFHKSFGFAPDSLGEIRFAKALYRVDERGAYSVALCKCPFMITCTIPSILNAF